MDIHLVNQILTSKVGIILGIIIATAILFLIIIGIIKIVLACTFLRNQKLLTAAKIYLVFALPFIVAMTDSGKDSPSDWLSSHIPFFRIIAALVLILMILSIVIYFFPKSKTKEEKYADIWKA